MESTLTAIGALTVIALVMFFFLSNEDKKKHEADYYEKFLERGDESKRFKSFYYKHSNLSREQALRKFYSDEENFNRAQKLLDAHNEWVKENNDKQKKKYTIKRVYSYQYEDFIYSLYSPLASYHIMTGWTCLFESLPREYIIKKIAENQNLNDKQACSLFEKFVENELITEDISEISSTNKKVVDNYMLGSTLTTYADVVNDSDMNINKWIEKNGQSMTKEELENELNKY